MICAYFPEKGIANEATKNCLGSSSLSHWLGFEYFGLGEQARDSHSAHVQRASIKLQVVVCISVIQDNKK
jgi:hypothetical protein